MLLSLPAAVALAICAEAFATGIFRGGKMTAENSAIMAQYRRRAGLRAARLCAGQGVPAGLLQPRGHAHPGVDRRRRADRSTSRSISTSCRATASSGWPPRPRSPRRSTSLTLYTILQLRGWFHFTAKLAGRIARQILATAAMGAVLCWLMPMLAPYWTGHAGERVLSLALLVVAGGISFLAPPTCSARSTRTCWRQLRRKRPAKPVDLAD